MSRLVLAARRGRLALVALVLACATTARGVVIEPIYDAPTKVAPGDDPGWANVGYLSTASGVYLGNRWVLTANHVGDGSFRLSDGRAFPAVPGSSVQLPNTGGLASLGAADLRMFRLLDDPGLPSLTIDDTRPASGAGVIMIGAGHDRAPGVTGWRVTNGASGLDWTQVALPLANELGYSLLSSQTMRWGTNAMQSGTVFAGSTTLAFNTSFTKQGTAFEAQAVSGDSGGGVFSFADGGWKLVGIMDAQEMLSNQPAGTAVFGNQTQSADLSVYRAQIMSLVNQSDPLWQNQRNYFDSNHSGTLSAIDALLIINELRAKGAHTLGATHLASDPFYDVNGDGSVTSLDALRVINALMGVKAASASASASGATFVPEPSGAVLALVGGLVAVAWRAYRHCPPAPVHRLNRKRGHRHGRSGPQLDHRVGLADSAMGGRLVS